MAGKGRTPYLSAEQQQQVIDRFSDGTPASELARDLSVGKHVIYNALRKAGLNPSQNQQHGISSTFTDAEEEAMVARYLETRKKTDVAREFNVPYSTLHKLLVRRGVDIGVKIPDIDDRAIELYKSGKSQVEVAAILDVSQGRISSVIRKSGVTRRGRGMAKGPEHRSWKGGLFKDKRSGYWLRWIDRSDPMSVMANASGYVMEHRLVMARYFKRPLMPYETVHHIDSNRSNNELPNLQLRIGKHGAGARLRCSRCKSHDLEYIPLDELPPEDS